MKTTILSTANAAAVDIKTALVSTTAYTTPGTTADRYRIRPKLVLTNLNGAAATMIVKIRDTTNSRTLWQSAIAKDLAADTGMVIQFPSVDVVGGTNYAVQVLSSNTSDSSVTWLTEWYDATAMDTTAVAGTAQTARDLGASVIVGSDVLGNGRKLITASGSETQISINNNGVDVTYLGGLPVLAEDVGGNAILAVKAVDASLAWITPLTIFAEFDATLAAIASAITAVPVAVEQQIMDEDDTRQVLQAIVNKIAEANPDLSGLTLTAIAQATRTEMDDNSTKLAHLDVDVSTRLAAADYTAPDNDAATSGAADASAAAQSITQLATDLAPVIARMDVAISSRPTAAQIDAQLSGTHGDGSWEGGGGTGTGNGDVAVNHNTGGTDALRITTSGGDGIDDVRIRAYLKSDYDAGTRNVLGEAFTGSDGRWEMDLMLDSGTYVLAFSKSGYSFPNAEVTV